MKWKICFLSLAIIFIYGFKSTFIDDVNLTGTWHQLQKSETSEFDLVLIQNDKTLIGEHCSVMFSGNRIDCANIDGDGNQKTLKGIWDGSKWIINFTSTYCEKPGKAIIEVQNERKLIWRVTEEPDGEYYIPNEAVLIRDK